MRQIDTEEGNEDWKRSRSLSIRTNNSPVRSGPIGISYIRASLNELYHSLATVQLLKEHVGNEAKAKIRRLNMAAIHITRNFRRSSLGQYLDSLDTPLDVSDSNNNCPANEDETPQKPTTSSTQNSPLKTLSAPLLARETSAKASRWRLPARRNGALGRWSSKKQDYMLLPLKTGLFGDVLQKLPNGKPKYTDIMAVIYQGTSQHKNVDTTTAGRYESLKTLDESPGKRLYYVKPLPEEYITLDDLIKPRKGSQVFYIPLPRDSAASQTLHDKIMLLTEFQAKFVCANLLLAAKFLIENEIVHGSLLPKKIIFNEKYYPQIACFNSAEILSERLSRFRTRMPLEYTAPEQCYEDVYENTDVFTIGVIIYEAIFGRTPHRGVGDYETRKNLCNYKFMPEFDSSKLSTEGQRFLKYCLKKSERKRLNLANLKRGLFISAAWFNELDEDKIFEQTFPSPLRAKIQAFTTEQKKASPQ